MWGNGKRSLVWYYFFLISRLNYNLNYWDSFSWIACENSTLITARKKSLHYVRTPILH